MSRFFYLVHVLLAFSSSGALAVVPGGLVASHNNGTGAATSMDVTIAVESAPPDSSSYFFAQQFFTSTTIDHGGYFGLQTGGVIGNQNVGKMLIFSIWNADQAEAGPGAVAQPFGGEGVGYSVRMPFQWSQGIGYRFRLEKDGPLWWKLTLADPAQGTIYLGRIRITQDVPLQPHFAAFTEYFRDLPACSDLPSLKVSFADLVFGSTLLPVADSFSYGTCASEARGQIRGNAAVHEVRPPEVPEDPVPPAVPGLTSASLPGFRFWVRISDARIGTAAETPCPDETVCVAGAIPNRAEVFVRIVGPKPNGYLWPNVVKFNTTKTEVWIQQVSTGSIKYYLLPALAQDSEVLPGLVDKTGFLP